MSKIFEQKNNSVAFLLIVAAATLWGVFGLIASLAQVQEISPILFTLSATFFATIVVIFYLLIKKVQIIYCLKECFKIQEFKKLLMYRTLVSFNILVMVAAYHFLSNKIIGVVITEINPLIAVILSYYFFTSDEYEKKTNRVYSWILIIMAFSGVVITLLNEVDINELYKQIQTSDLSNNIIGMLLSILGAILIGYTTILGPKITAVLNKSELKEDQLLTSFEISNIARLVISGVTFLILIIVSLFFHDLGDYQILFSSESLFLAFVFGVFIIYIPAILGMVGGAIANTHNIYLGWFVAPIMGVFSLWLFGFGEINTVIVLSFLLVLVPNILLNLEIEDSFSFKVTFIWILLSTVILFYYPGNAIDRGTYFSVSNTLLVFFALMVGYLITKLDRRSTYREQLFMNFLRNLRQQKELGEDVIDNAITELSLSFQQANSRVTNSVHKVIEKYNINTDKYTELHDFEFIKPRKLFSTSELFVLILISGLLLGITILYKQNNFLYDIYAFIIGASVVFTLSQVVEMMFFGEYNKKFDEEKKQTQKYMVAASFLTILVFAIVLLFLSKHGFNLSAKA